MRRWALSLALVGAFTLGLSGTALANSDNTLTAENITVAAGASTGTVEVATWTDVDLTCPIASNGDLVTATVDWGDGTVSPGTVACNSDNNGGNVTGSHTYARVGTFTITVTFDDDDTPAGGGDEGAIQSTSTATVTGPSSKAQCMNGGWQSFGTSFKTQGDCVSFVATKGKNQPSGK